MLFACDGMRKRGKTKSNVTPPEQNFRFGGEEITGNVPLLPRGSTRLKKREWANLAHLFRSGEGCILVPFLLRPRSRKSLKTHSFGLAVLLSFPFSALVATSATFRRNAGNREECLNKKRR